MTPLACGLTTRSTRGIVQTMPRIDHVAVESEDPDGTATFYERFFGARIVRTEDHPVMAYLGNTAFALHEPAARARTPPANVRAGGRGAEARARLGRRRLARARYTRSPSASLRGSRRPPPGSDLVHSGGEDQRDLGTERGPAMPALSLAMKQSASSSMSGESRNTWSSAARTKFRADCPERSCRSQVVRRIGVLVPW